MSCFYLPGKRTKGWSRRVDLNHWLTWVISPGLWPAELPRRLNKQRMNGQRGGIWTHDLKLVSASARALPTELRPRPKIVIASEARKASEAISKQQIWLLLSGDCFVAHYHSLLAMTFIYISQNPASAGKARHLANLRLAVLPSSLAKVHPITLVYSTRPPVLVCGTDTLNLILEVFLGHLTRLHWFSPKAHIFWQSSRFLIEEADLPASSR